MVRIKHRYLLLNILYPTPPPQQKGKADEKDLPWTVTFRRPSPDRLNPQLLARMIRDGVAELFGEYGAGMVAGSLQVKYLSSATSTAIVRVSRAHDRLVWAALSFVTHVPGGRPERCVVQVVRVSGTIKKVEEEAVRLARRGIVRAQKGPEALEDDMDQIDRMEVIDSDGSGDEG
ncbi:related to POP5 Protein required for processing of tRNAs and rRNAs [Ramularia collo-cygni]|uniref:Ribonuclease P/MRP protein subunit POP5 n=1 Tax=Ramularia collo-cygni TaxID=112498 RepID=A0A2D3V8G5_9PEZI|nr:related to POP5 Protein required for processing of tRNAs and rRNAs [Ramularia collo-cygni]CZT23210.1 related to POP5 Protein required for processing of tRNAs and rRNAs [Ramularia collo-cygni]